MILAASDNSVLELTSPFLERSVGPPLRTIRNLEQLFTVTKMALRVVADDAASAFTEAALLIMAGARIAVRCAMTAPNASGADLI